ncbi:MAG: hypothetical protein AAF830_01355 [Pseudomonadota bacterium]
MIGLSLLLLTLMDVPPALEERAKMPAATQAQAYLSGADIVAMAHEAAGGQLFVRPGSLFLEGYNIIRTPDGGEIVWDRYAMWRVFSEAKDDAHQASGKVRIEAWTEGELSLLLAFDGRTTSNQDGPMTDQSANTMWSNSFGYGAIRNALDEGWTQVRKTDRMIDGQLAYMVELTDRSRSKTLFGIRQSDAAIVYVGFQTPRGWHERRYSEFFEKPGLSWRQAGRVRLFYDGVKSNEAVWTDFRIGRSVDESIFRVETPPKEPTF